MFSVRIKARFREQRSCGISKSYVSAVISWRRHVQGIQVQCLTCFDCLRFPHREIGLLFVDGRVVRFLALLQAWELSLDQDSLSIKFGLTLLVLAFAFRFPDTALKIR